MTELATIERLKQLVGRYFEAIDDGYKLDRLADVMAPDVRVEMSIGTPLLGRDAFVAAQREISAVMRWAFHLVVPIRIDVADDGRSARGRWHVLGLHTMAPPGVRELVPAFYTAVYRIRFEDRPQLGWRIVEQVAEFQQLSRTSGGWVTERFFDLTTWEGRPWDAST